MGLNGRSMHIRFINMAKNCFVKGSPGKLLFLLTTRVMHYAMLAIKD